MNSVQLAPKKENFTHFKIYFCNFSARSDGKI